MEEKQINKNTEGQNPLVYTALLLIGMMSVGFFSFYIPTVIFALVIFAPFALSMDMKQSRPVLSLGMLIISAIFLYFNQYDFAIYIILVISTGVSSLICYIVWRYLNTKSFSDGLLYSVFSTVLLGIIAALVIFILRERQPFAQEIVTSFEGWLRSSDAAIIEYIYRYYKAGTALTLAETQKALLEPIDGVSKTQLINTIMPFVQNGVNQFSLFAMVLYPAFTGVITWWRGNARFYKNQPMDEDNKELKPKPFSTFELPRWLFITVLIMFMVSFFVMISDYGEVLFNAAVLVQNFAYTLFIIQGFAVLEYFLKRSAVLSNSIIRVMLLALIFIISGGLIPIFIGFTDRLFNIRLVYVKTQELKRKMYQKAQENKNKDENDKEDDK